MTTDELVAKFRMNAEGVIPAGKADTVVDAVLNLETVSDISVIMKQLSSASA